MRFSREIPKWTRVTLLVLIVAGVASGTTVLLSPLSPYYDMSGAGMPVSKESLTWIAITVLFWLGMIFKSWLDIRREQGPKLSDEEVRTLIETISIYPPKERRVAVRQLASMARRGNRGAGDWLTKDYPSPGSISDVAVTCRTHRATATETVRIRRRSVSFRLLGCYTIIDRMTVLWYLVTTISAGGIALIVDSTVPESFDNVVSIIALLPYLWAAELRPWQRQQTSSVSGLRESELFLTWIESVGTVREAAEAELLIRQGSEARWIQQKLCFKV